MFGDFMCNHIVGFYEGSYENGELITEQQLDSWILAIEECPSWCPDLIDFFEHCPRCGREV